jgi:hypothetical protein
MSPLNAAISTTTEDVDQMYVNIGRKLTEAHKH